MRYDDDVDELNVGGWLISLLVVNALRSIKPADALLGCCEGMTPLCILVQVDQPADTDQPCRPWSRCELLSVKINQPYRQ